MVTADGASGERERDAIAGLARVLGPAVRRDVRLAPFTSVQVGGPADLLIEVESTDDLVNAVAAAREWGVPWRVLGGACNVLIADQGLRGLVIINRAGAIDIDVLTVCAESGASMARLARRCAQAGLAGLTWAAGLPGTVGGAVIGNAGAFGGDVAETLLSATLLEADGSFTERDNEWFAFGYRGSRLKREREQTRVVLSATFGLQPGDRTELLEQVDRLLAERRVRYPSGATMGSTFVNPPNGFAGQLIDEAGLKGYRVGGAHVSPKHANFLVNDENATAEDVLHLIEHIREEVERHSGVELTLEVELLGW